MGINFISLSNVEVADYENNLALVENIIGTNGKPMTKVTLIDKEKSAMIGHYLYDMNDQIIASAEIKEFYVIDGCHLPKVVYFIWYEENVRMTWRFSRPLLNTSLDISTWEMPNMRNKKRLGIS